MRVNLQGTPQKKVDYFFKLLSTRKSIDDYLASVEKDDSYIQNKEMKNFRKKNLELFYDIFVFYSDIRNMDKKDFAFFINLLDDDLDKQIGEIPKDLAKLIINETKFHKIDKILNPKPRLTYLTEMTFDYLYFLEKNGFENFIDGFNNIDFNKFKKSIDERLKFFREYEVFDNEDLQYKYLKSKIDDLINYLYKQSQKEMFEKETGISKFTIISQKEV